MCGFAGEFVFGGDGSASASGADVMATRLAHRGPDDAAAWISADRRCAIGFRRLAVIDPPLSRQPMTGPDERFTIAFNGEIYNFAALREELSGVGEQFRTNGDTEVLLAAWRRHGAKALDDLAGMFAFAIYDEAERCLTLARDRLGQKPLWYSLLADRIVFASEAKALLAHPGVSARPDPQAVGAYLTVGYVPGPASIWRDVVKLPPGHVMSVSGAAAEPRPYWRLPQETKSISRDDAVSAVREALSAAVAERMVADVPLGALLSGGVDSSIVTALMCKAAGAGGGVKTFTAGFAAGEFDERPFAREVAEHLGTDHHELLIEAADAEELLDQLVGQYDEPFADSSALPTYMVCQAAREHVTVALCGDGGDEAFAGYDRHRAMHLAGTMGPGRWLLVKAAAAGARLIAPHDERSRLRRLVRFSAGLDQPPAGQYFAYRRLFSPEQLEALLERDFAAAARPGDAHKWFCELYEQGEFDDEAAHAQHHDLLTYLPDDLLVKADIASMASSLELRSPMLAHGVVSLGLSLPVGLKIRGRRGKAILQDAFGEMLPPGLFDRPKRGFAAPIDGWLRNELLGTLRETLLEGPLVKEGWISYLRARRMIDDHLSRQADHRHRLWALLWLGRWLARQ